MKHLLLLLLFSILGSSLFAQPPILRVERKPLDLQDEAILTRLKFVSEKINEVIKGHFAITARVEVEAVQRYFDLKDKDVLQALKLADEFAEEYSNKTGGQTISLLLGGLIQLDQQTFAINGNEFTFEGEQRAAPAFEIEMSFETSHLLQIKRNDGSSTYQSFIPQIKIRDLHNHPKWNEAFESLNSDQMQEYANFRQSQERKNIATAAANVLAVEMRLTDQQTQTLSVWLEKEVVLNDDMTLRDHVIRLIRNTSIDDYDDTVPDSAPRDFLKESQFSHWKRLQRATLSLGVN